MPITKRGLNQEPDSYNFQGMETLYTFAATPGAGVAGTTVQDIWLPTTRCKIYKVGIAFTAVDNLVGADNLNIVVGTGSYETAGTQGTVADTIAGTWATSDVVNITIDGVLSTYTATASHTVTQVAAGIVAAINANAATTGTLGGGKPLNQYISAANNAGVVTISSALGDTNAYTNTVSKTSTSGTISAGAATLTAGTATTGIVVPNNDNSIDQALPGGVGYNTTANFPALGNALFAADIPISNAASAAFSETTGTGWQTITTTGGWGIFIPTSYDAEYGRAVALTLRVNTLAGSGAITNLRVSLVGEKWPQRVAWENPNTPSITNPTPGPTF